MNEEEPVAGTADGAERVRIRSVGRRVRVIADPTVASVAVNGPHLLRRAGSVLEVASEGQGSPFEGFSLLKLPRSVDELRSLGLGTELVVRAHPSLAVDAEVTGSGLVTEGMPILGRIRVTAGSASLTGVQQAADVLVQAGGATLEGTFSTGSSRVKCESGALTVLLAEGANVTVRGQAQLGRVTWPGDGLGSVDEWVVGAGSGRLDLEAVIGMVTVRDATGPAGSGPAPESSTCPHCGEPGQGGRFCSSCGKELKPRCVGCGEPLPTGARFCPACGAAA